MKKKVVSVVLCMAMASSVFAGYAAGTDVFPNVAWAARYAQRPDAGAADTVGRGHVPLLLAAGAADPGN